MKFSPARCTEVPYNPLCPERRMKHEAKRKKRTSLPPHIQHRYVHVQMSIRKHRSLHHDIYAGVRSQRRHTHIGGALLKFPWAFPFLVLLSRGLELSSQNHTSECLQFFFLAYFSSYWFISSAFFFPRNISISIKISHILLQKKKKTLIKSPNSPISKV